MYKKNFLWVANKETGFTLLELIVGLALASIVAGAIAMAWITQQRTYMHETECNFVQNNLRAAVLLLERDLRSAGYMENCASKPCLSFTSANASSVAFQTWDDDSNSVMTIKYALYNSGAGGGQALGRQVNSSSIQPVAFNIDAIDFVYLDNNGTILPRPVPIDKLDNINLVQIAIVGRGSKATPINSPAPQTFRNLQGNTIYTAPADSIVRRILLTQVYCRNNFPK